MLLAHIVVSILSWRRKGGSNHFNNRRCKVIRLHRQNQKQFYIFKENNISPIKIVLQILILTSKYNFTKKLFYPIKNNFEVRKKIYFNETAIWKYVKLFPQRKCNLIINNLTQSKTVLFNNYLLVYK